MIFNLMKPIPIAEPTMYLYGHEADKTVSYNGVVLPELPVWDREQYPYAIISYNSAGFYSLRCFSVEPSAYSVANLTLVPYSENGYGISTTSRENEWGEFGEPSEFGSLVQSFTKGIIWTNFDLRYKGTEDVHFEASDPITAYTNADVTIGGVGYVGAVLPKLPEWDKTAYPYAFIAFDGTDYRLYFSTVNVYLREYRDFVTDELKGYILDGCADGTAQRYKLNEDSTEWEDYGTEKIFQGAYVFGSSSLDKDVCVWTNTDILDKDGNLYLSASDPIPVYE